MVGSGSTRVALACGVFAVTAIGCGDSSGGGRTPTASVTVSTTSVPGPDYATRLNSLCAELLPKVIAIYGGGHPGPYPITVFEAEQPGSPPSTRPVSYTHLTLPTTERV